MTKLPPNVAISSDKIEAALQVEDIYLHELHATREAVEEGAPPVAPSFVPRVRGWQLSADGSLLSVIFGAVLRYQYRPIAVAQVDVGVLGIFRAEAAIDHAYAGGFATREAVILLWPYLRSFVGQAAHDMQVEFPTVPVLDVPKFTKEMERLRKRARKPPRQ